MSNTIQSNVAFSFAIDPQIPVTDPSLQKIYRAKAGVAISFPGSVSGSGAASLGSGMPNYAFSDLPQLLAAAPPATSSVPPFSLLSPSTKSLIGPQPLDVSQASLCYDTLHCALTLDLLSMACWCSAAGSMTIPFGARNVALLLTSWTFAPLATLGGAPLLISATMQVTVDGVAQHVTLTNPDLS